jgi:hypothetical protein
VNATARACGFLRPDRGPDRPGEFPRPRRRCLKLLDVGGRATDQQIVPQPGARGQAERIAVASGVGLPRDSCGRAVRATSWRLRGPADWPGRQRPFWSGGDSVAWS